MNYTERHACRPVRTVNRFFIAAAVLLGMAVILASAALLNWDRMGTIGGDLNCYGATGVSGEGPELYKESVGPQNFLGYLKNNFTVGILPTNMIHSGETLSQLYVVTIPAGTKYIFNFSILNGWFNTPTDDRYGITYGVKNLAGADITNTSFTLGPTAGSMFFNVWYHMSESMLTPPSPVYVRTRIYAVAQTA